MTDLVVAPCSFQAAKFAVEHWHYSGVLPYGKKFTLGVWECKRFVGCVVFSYGATPHIGKPYNLGQFEICELTRVALNQHSNYVSRIIKLCVSTFKKNNPGIRLIVSFADSEQGHLGIIYQANNWIYTGSTKPGRVGFVIHGKKIHTRSVGAKPGGIQSLEWVRSNLDPNAKIWSGEKKHRYLYPLDRAMRRQVLPLAQPYPKKEHAGEVSTVICHLPDEGAGSSPAARSLRSDTIKT